MRTHFFLRSITLAAGLAIAAAGLAVEPDESRVEQLMAAPAAPPKPAAAAKPDKKAAAQNDNDTVASLVGQRVAVETRQHGVYIGTLTAASREAITLLIPLASRELNYSLPRSDVAAVTAR
ncbi:MAG: hypothetical protein JNN30_21075 [Rhodanobacteraceae bacterium]|nr:hypothetical protein [Rhodanobacteraceae bacterium]